MERCSLTIEDEVQGRRPVLFRPFGPPSDGAARAGWEGTGRIRDARPCIRGDPHPGESAGRSHGLPLQISAFRRAGVVEHLFWR